MGKMMMMMMMITTTMMMMMVIFLSFRFVVDSQVLQLPKVGVFTSIVSQTQTVLRPLTVASVIYRLRVTVSFVTVAAPATPASCSVDQNCCSFH